MKTLFCKLVEYSNHSFQTSLELSLQKTYKTEGELIQDVFMKYMGVKIVPPLGQIEYLTVWELMLRYLLTGMEILMT